MACDVARTVLIVVFVAVLAPPWRGGEACLRSSCPASPGSRQCSAALCQVGYAPNDFCATDGNAVLDFGNQCYRDVARCAYEGAGLALRDVVCLKATAACPTSCPLYYTPDMACGIDPTQPGNPVLDYGNECGFGLAQCKSGGVIQRVRCEQAGATAQTGFSGR